MPDAEPAFSAGTAETMMSFESVSEAPIPAERSNVDSADLLGYWLLVEAGDGGPAGGQEVRYQFTAEGDFVRYAGDEAERARYTFSAPDQITVDGPSGLTFYDYRLRGDELTLTQPGEGGASLSLRKLADESPEAVPGPMAVPEEDSVPADSM